MGLYIKSSLLVLSSPDHFHFTYLLCYFLSRTRLTHSEALQKHSPYITSLMIWRSQLDSIRFQCKSLCLAEEIWENHLQDTACSPSHTSYYPLWLNNPRPSAEVVPQIPISIAVVASPLTKCPCLSRVQLSSDWLMHQDSQQSLETTCHTPLLAI